MGEGTGLSTLGRGRLGVSLGCSAPALGGRGPCKVDGRGPDKPRVPPRAPPASRSAPGKAAARMRSASCGARQGLLAPSWHLAPWAPRRAKTPACACAADWLRDEKELAARPQQLALGSDPPGPAHPRAQRAPPVGRPQGALGSRGHHMALCAPTPAHPGMGAPPALRGPACRGLRSSE